MDLTVWEVRKDRPVNSLVGTSKFNNFAAQTTIHECTQTVEIHNIVTLI